MGRGHDRELDMDMKYDSPPTSLMEAMLRAGTKISLDSSSTAVFNETNDDVGPVKSTLRNGKSSTLQDSNFAYVHGKSRV